MNLHYYEARWPKDGLYLTCYVHEVMNFRYHWHAEEYEINVLLQGQQHYCRGKESFLLQEGDVILVEPNVGHASYAQAQNTIALVLRFSARALRQLAPKGSLLCFPSCRSSEKNRDEPRYRAIRNLTAQLVQALGRGDAIGQYAAKAAMEMMIGVFCLHFDPRPYSAVPEISEETQRTVQTVISYLEEHYPERINLEQIAALTQYNRTYLSAMFHKAVGISFYDYLTRVRLQKALHELTLTDKNLTDIAFSNGFADLKTFNSRFRELLQCLPAEYRRTVRQTVPTLVGPGVNPKYLPRDNPIVAACFLNYLGKEGM